MLKLRPLLLLALCAAPLLCATEARADPVVVTGGAINGTMGRDTIFLNPNGNGFGMSFFPSSYGHSFVSETCVFRGASATCSAVQFTTITADVSLGAGPPASLTLNGVQFTPLALQGTTLRFEISRFSHLTIAPVFGQPGRYTADLPFTMTGTIVAGNWNPTNGLMDGPPLFSFDVSGAGRALINVREEGDRFFIDFVSYQFQPQPVPEPAAIILFGTSAAGLAARLFRRRRRSAR